MINKLLGKAVMTLAGRDDFAIPKHDSPLFEGVDWDNLPRHVAVIMDGNGRWANAQGQVRTVGHSAGAKVLKNILKTAIGLNLEALTVYAFSTENWTRPAAEVKFLMNLIYGYLKQELQEMHEDNVRIHFIGDIAGLPDYLQEEIREAEELMKNNTGIKFNVATNYGAQDEMIRAIQKIAVSVQNGEITPADIQKELIEDSLDTCGNPPVDLLIRTGGDHRLSNFLLWQVAYAEFYSAEVPWPEFSPKCFVEAIKEFNNRDRRFGGLNDDKK